MTWLFEGIVVLLLFLFIDSIGFWGSVGLMAIINTAYALLQNLPVAGVISAFIEGAVLGVFAYVFVKVFFALVEIFGNVLYFILIIGIILAVLAFII